MVSPLIYTYQRVFIAAWCAKGNTATVRRDRNGSPRISLNGSRERNMHDSMNRIETWLGSLPATERRDLLARF